MGERKNPPVRDNAERYERLRLPVHEVVRFVIVRPHYPENVGAIARAIKTMGFYRMGLVKPGRLAVPEHEMAQKMAVKSWDVLESAERYATVDEAVAGADLVVGTSARRGISGVRLPRDAAMDLVERCGQGQKLVILLGNEKTGLSEREQQRATMMLRIPMAADQPSVNLAQSAQIIAYELFVAALAARG
jgi:TrmH family RNA methyltransferase